MQMHVTYLGGNDKQVNLNQDLNYQSDQVSKHETTFTPGLLRMQYSDYVRYGTDKTTSVLLEYNLLTLMPGKASNSICTPIRKKFFVLSPPG